MVVGWLLVYLFRLNGCFKLRPCIFTNFQALLFLLNKRYLDWPQTSCQFSPLSVGIFPPVVAFFAGLW